MGVLILLGRYGCRRFASQYTTGHYEYHYQIAIQKKRNDQIHLFGNSSRKSHHYSHHYHSNLVHGYGSLTPSGIHGQHGRAHNCAIDAQIRILCIHGQLQRAVDMLCSTSTSLPTDVYISLLKLCSNAKVLHSAEKLHLHLVETLVDLTGLLGDYLVVALANCGAVDQAYSLLCKLQVRTVFSWTAIISAYTEIGFFEEAVKMYKRMQDDGVQASSHTFVSLFKACSNLPALQHGTKLYTEACKKGFTGNVFVGNTLLSMYGKCGKVAEAEEVFQGLQLRDIVTWNAMLGTYVQQDLVDKALLLYRQIIVNGETPNQHTYVCSLQACTALLSKESVIVGNGKVMALDIGQALHADAHKDGVTTDVFVGTTLLTMYAKAKDAANVENVFGPLAKHDIVSWNAMLSALIEQGQYENALRFFAHMQDRDTYPDQLTYVVTLKACGCIADNEEALTIDALMPESVALEIGCALHLDSQKYGFMPDTVFGTALLSMYGKCGALPEAEDVFTRLFERDIVSWNVLITAYIQKIQCEKALLLYRQMEEEGVSSDQHTFVSALHSCGVLAEKEESTLVDGRLIKPMLLEIGMSLHGSARAKGIAFDLFICNTLVSMYAKCGVIEPAEHVFSSLARHDVVSWNSMLFAYVQLGLAHKALKLYAQMLGGGVHPDHLTFVTLIQACGLLAEKEEHNLKDGISSKSMFLHIGEALHADVCRNGYESEVQVANTLISMYGKCGAIHEAEDVFRDVWQYGIVSWTAMLSAYVEQGLGKRALQFYSQMQDERVIPNQLTLGVALQACGLLAEKEETIYADEDLLKVKSLLTGHAIHSSVVIMGYELENFLSALLMSMYGKFGAIMEAENILFSASHSDVNCWNGMLSVYITHEQSEKAIQLYFYLKDLALAMDDVTFISLLQACAETGFLDVCSEIHFNLINAGYDQITSIAVTLIHAYGSCACMMEADKVLDGLPNADLVAWTACISGHAGEGSLSTCINALAEFLMTGIEPDTVMFTALLSACSHAGLVVQGLKCFELMQRIYNIAPVLQHYGAIVDLVGRAGDFKRVAKIMERMPLQNDLSFWLCLLGACRLHGNLDVARQAFDCATKIHPEEAASYILMSNIYSEAELYV